MLVGLLLVKSVANLNAECLRRQVAAFAPQLPTTVFMAFAQRAAAFREGVVPRHRLVLDMSRVSWGR